MINSDFSLGVIEGFFGKPWSDADRLDTLNFLKPLGFSYYVYAPKADRYLRRLWHEPMPAADLSRLAALSSRFRANGISFGVGLSPYEAHLNYSSEAKAALRAKVAQLNQIGVERLCILFDDMRGGSSLARLQAHIVADIAGWSHARTFFICPTYYSDDPVLARLFGEPPENYLRDLGHNLDAGIEVFWTGEKVCSTNYSDSHLQGVAERLGRKPHVWDNCLANDGQLRCAHLFLDLESLGWSLNAQLVSGVAVNPMNQAHLSRMPLAAQASHLAGRGEGGGRSLMRRVRAVCGEALGEQVLADLELFQVRGLRQLGAAERETLQQRYARFTPQACAEEIGAWLRGEYDFDPQCLTS